MPQDFILKMFQCFIHLKCTYSVIFILSGVLDRAICNIEEPLRGSLTVEHSVVPVKSIELQLVRVETCGCAEG